MLNKLYKLFGRWLSSWLRFNFYFNTNMWVKNLKNQLRSNFALNVHSCLLKVLYSILFHLRENVIYISFLTFRTTFNYVRFIFFPINGMTLIIVHLKLGCKIGIFFFQYYNILKKSAKTFSFLSIQVICNFWKFPI